MQPVRTCIALVILLWAIPSHATIFFDDSFETCSVGTGNDFPCEGWNDFGQESANRLAVMTDQAFSGSKSVKGTWISIFAEGATPSIYKNLPTPLSHAFIRWATRRGTPWQPSGNGNTKLMIIGNVAYPRPMIVDSFNDYSVIIECPYNVVENGNRVQTVHWHGGGAPTPNAWDEIELEMKYNVPGQANGEVRFWKNGVLKLTKLNLELRGPTPTSFHPSCTNKPSGSDTLIRTIQLYVQGGVGDRWHDRIAVGDTRIGPVGPQSGDTTPPGPVVNFRVN